MKLTSCGQRADQGTRGRLDKVAQAGRDGVSGQPKGPSPQCHPTCFEPDVVRDRRKRTVPDLASDGLAD
jgi:hypothetical protein